MKSALYASASVPKGDKSPNWRGSDVGKLALHDRVFKLRGRASSHPCLGISSHCTIRAKQWATLHGTDGLDPYRDYVPLCLMCHVYYDRPRRIKKLTPDKVSEIKQLLREGVTRKEIARSYPEARTMIGKIARGECWSDVP